MLQNLRHRFAVDAEQTRHLAIALSINMARKTDTAVQIHRIHLPHPLLISVKCQTAEF